ncbi:MAG: hypothetical protein Kow0077_07760 [Anaerolineae bacterium]
MNDNPYLPDDISPDEIRPALPPPEAESSARPGCLSANAVTLIFVLLTVAFLIYFGTLLVNPYLPINPFPPRTPLPIYVVATPDPGEAVAALVPTKPPVTPRLTTLVPTITPSPTPTVTPSPTATQAAIVPPRLPTVTRPPATATLIGAVTPERAVAAVFTPPAPVDPAQVTRSPFPFTLANGVVVYVPNPNDEACRWASIAGTAVSLSGEQISGLAVRVIGEGIDEIRFTGTAPEFGPGGYEVFLNGAPLEAQYTVQLLSQTGVPLSEALAVTTSASCEENVAVVNFVQNHAY